MKIRINGEDQDVPENLTVSSLLEHLGMAGNRVAIERNLGIVPRSDWAETKVQLNDSFELVHFVGGG